jgi:hypothetical protein
LELRLQVVVGYDKLIKALEVDGVRLLVLLDCIGDAANAI